MTFYTRREFNKAGKIALKHKVLGIRFLQIVMGTGYGKSAKIVSDLRDDKKYKDLPDKISNSEMSKIAISHNKRNEKKDLIEKLYDLLDDEKGREIVKLCLKNYKEEGKAYKVMFNEIQNKYFTGYARTDKYLQIAKSLQKIIDTE